MFCLITILSNIKVEREGKTILPFHPNKVQLNQMLNVFTFLIQFFDPSLSNTIELSWVVNHFRMLQFLKNCEIQTQIVLCMKKLLILCLIEFGYIILNKPSKLFHLLNNSSKVKNLSLGLNQDMQNISPCDIFATRYL